MSSADDQYEQQNDVTGGDVPSGSKIDNDYASRTGQYQIPVQKDEAPVADPINPDTADSDQTLAQDDKEAIDQSNIIGGRTRGAKPSGGYTEPGDEEGLPGADDGTSRGASS
ncbi:MAG: hypothetical protein L6R37_000602 [Teloschistes peruensis]|nr:MAG: hypothetical protein L6R37_000602 [Teloschistes peruensis]KAI4203747.1 MAG: hypothetical protein LQ350_001573 [Niorma chrysophthalma]